VRPTVRIEISTANSFMLTLTSTWFTPQSNKRQLSVVFSLVFFFRVLVPGFCVFGGFSHFVAQLFRRFLSFF
jgi:hypothetical protein